MPGSAGPLTGASVVANGSGIYHPFVTGMPELTTNLLPLMRCFRSASMNNILNKPALRLLAFLLISFPLRLMLDLIYALLYRNYPLIRPGIEYLGAALFTALILELLYYFKRKLNTVFPWERNPLRRLMLEISAGTVLFGGIITGLSLLIAVYLTRSLFIQFSDQAILTVYYLFFLVYIPALVGFAVFLLNRWRTSLAEMERYKKENAEYKFETLRTQVNPHFLFNSLNTLSSLVYEDRDKASGFIRDLSDVYRYVLDNRNRDTVLLGEELKFIRAFVYLYQLRFDNKLKVDIAVSEADYNRLIAPMTLQLLVENAVKHNVVSAARPLSIRIATDKNACISVSNNLQKKSTAVVSSEIGLKNIISRYAYLTAEPVVVEENEHEFLVKIPLI